VVAVIVREAALDDELELNEVREVSPGVTVVRRSAVFTLAGLFAAALPSGAARAQAQAMAQSSLTFEAFLSEAKPIAAALIGDTSRIGQSRYLLGVAAVAARLSDVPVPERMNDSGQGETPGTFVGFNPGGDPFNVLHWRMEPGARIRPHAHTYGNVVTLGLAGEALVENFEVVGERDFATNAAFEARRTHAQILQPGSVNLINLERDYMHGFTAGAAGARGLDITTRLAPRAPTPYLIIPAAADRNAVFSAHWSLDDPMPMGT
jgi:hypothetical protein